MLALAAVAAIVVGLSAAMHEGPFTRVERGKVLVSGDSLVMQSSWAIDRKLSGYGYETSVSGVNGVTIGDQQQLLASYVGYNGASVVVLALGTNNAFYSLSDVGTDRTVTLDDSREEIAAATETATVEKPGAAFPLSVRCVVWVTITERLTAAGTQIAAPDINRMIRDEAAARTAAGKQVKVADWNGASKDHPEYFVKDGLHLDTTGQEAYATLIADEVRTCTL